VETIKTLSLYHHLIFKTVPLNLRPFAYKAHKPSPVHDKEFTSLNQLNSSRVIWKILSRTIYRPSKEWSHWLRNPSPINGDAFWHYKINNLTSSDREIYKKLQLTYGIKYLPNEERFYKMFKVTRKDLYQKLQS